MPSLSNLLAGICLTALVQLSTAAPASPALVKTAARDTECSTILATSTPTLPVNGGETELPAPANVTLKYIVIGRGIQNYTCTDVDSTPVALGAVATLYDGTHLAYTNSEAFHAIPPTIVYLPLSTSALAIGASTLPVLGNHYFNSAGTPTFDLTAVGEIFVGKKTANIKAPTTADIGPDGTGAVDWLQLQDKGGSVGVTEVYRVVTAGGNPEPTCSEAGIMSIQYATEYWMYG